MDFQDKTLTCSDCGQEFVFTAGEQQFYQEKGFGHEPRRCKPCRASRKGSGAATGGGAGSSQGETDSSGRQYYQATCSSCGGPARLPFNPNPDRPVFCRTCFQARQNDRAYR